MEKGPIANLYVVLKGSADKLIKAEESGLMKYCGIHPITEDGEILLGKPPLPLKGEGRVEGTFTIERAYIDLDDIDMDDEKCYKMPPVLKLDLWKVLEPFYKKLSLPPIEEFVFKEEKS